jgi:hypothetical protein
MCYRRRGRHPQICDQHASNRMSPADQSDRRRRRLRAGLKSPCPSFRRPFPNQLHFERSRRT